MRVSYVTLISDSEDPEKNFKRGDLNLELEGDVLNGFNYIMRKWISILDALSTGDKLRLPEEVKKTNIRDLIGKAKMILHRNVPIKGSLMGKTGYPQLDERHAFGIKPENYVDYVNEWIETIGDPDYTKLTKVITKYVNRDQEFASNNKYDQENKNKKYVAMFDGDEEFEYIGNLEDFIRGIVTYYHLTKLPEIFPNFYRLKKHFESPDEIEKEDVEDNKIVPVSFKLNGRMHRSKPFTVQSDEDEDEDESSEEDSE